MGIYFLRMAKLGPVHHSFRVLPTAICCRTLAVAFYCLLQTRQIIFDNKFSIFSILQMVLLQMGRRSRSRSPRRRRSRSRSRDRSRRSRSRDEERRRRSPKREVKKEREIKTEEEFDRRQDDARRRRERHVPGRREVRIPSEVGFKKIFKDYVKQERQSQERAGGSNPFANELRNAGEWGKPGEGMDKNTGKPVEKEKVNLGLSGALTADQNTYKVRQNY